MSTFNITTVRKDITRTSYPNKPAVTVSPVATSLDLTTDSTSDASSKSPIFHVTSRETFPKAKVQSEGWLLQLFCIQPIQ